MKYFNMPDDCYWCYQAYIFFGIGNCASGKLKAGAGCRPGCGSSEVSVKKGQRKGRKALKTEASVLKKEVKSVQDCD